MPTCARTLIHVLELTCGSAADMGLWVLQWLLVLVCTAVLQGVAWAVVVLGMHAVSL